MNAIARLESYLSDLHARFKRLRYVIAAAALALAVLLITALGVYFAMRQGFSVGHAVTLVMGGQHENIGISIRC